MFWYNMSMRKSLIIGLVAGIIIVAAVATIATQAMLEQARQTPTHQETNQTQPSQVQPETPAEAAVQTPGAYTNYSATTVNATKGTKLLFFHASWCPQCRALDKSIKEGQIPSGVTIFKVDYDTNQVLRQQYGVTIQTTIVKIDDNGKLIAKYVAYDQPTLQALIQNIL